MPNEIHSLTLSVDSRQVKNAEKDLNGLTNASGRVEGSTNKVTTSFFSLGRVLSATAILGTAAQFIKLADTMTGVESKLKLVTNSTIDLKTAQQELFAIAQKTRQGYAETVDTYSNFAVAMGDMGKSQKDILRVTETVNKAIAISGGTAQQAAAATMQLGQAFASGTLRGDELNSILENSKGLAKAIADGMGVPIGKLRTLGSEGKITAEILANALEKSAQSVDEKFGKVAPTVASSMTKVENSFLNMVGKVDDAINGSGGLASIMDDASKSVDKNSDHIAIVVGSLGNEVKTRFAGVGAGIGLVSSSVLYATTSLIETSINGWYNAFNQAGFYFNELKKKLGLDGSFEPIKLLDIGASKYKDQMKGYASEMEAIANRYENFSVRLPSKIGAPSDQKGSVKGGGGTTETEKERKARLKALKDAQKEAERVAKELADAQKKDDDYALQEAINHHQQLKENKKKYDEEIFQLTATDYEKTMKVIDDKAQAYRESGRTEVEIAKLVSLQKDAILEDEYLKATDQFDKLAEEMKGRVIEPFKLEFDASALEGVPKAIIAVGTALQDLQNIENEYQKDKTKYAYSSDLTAKNDEKHLKQQFKGYEQVAGAMSNMFKEGSDEAKSFSALQQTLAIANLAQSEAFAALFVSQEAAKSTAAGVTAVATAAQSSPWTGFATAAAMAAMLMSLGVMLKGGGGGGGSAPALPKSTVLGAKAGTESESTTAIVDILSEAHASEYSELRDINRAVTSMAQGIESAVANIFKSGILDTSGVSLKSGGIAHTDALTPSLKTFITDPLKVMTNLTKSVFGSRTKQYIAGSGFNIGGGTLGSKAAGNVGASTYVDVETMKKKAWGSTSYSHNITTSALDAASSQSISLIYKSFSDTMNEINKGLGTSLAPAISNYAIDAIKISTAGLSGEEVVKTLNDRFSALGDKMANDIFGRILNQYQDLGEGLLETAVRVITEKAVVMSNLKDINKSIYGDTIAITQSLVDLSGGLSEFSDANESYYDKYFSDAEKQVKLQAKLSESFSYLGVKMPTTIEGFRKLVEGTNLTTLAGRELFTGLMGISEGFAELQDNVKNTDISGLLDDIKAFVSSLRAEIVPISTSTSFTTFSQSFNDMITAIGNGSDNLSEIGIKAIDNARSYLDTVTATATSGRDIAFAKAVVANKFESVTLAPNVTMGTVNDTLKYSLGEQSYIVSELRAMRQELITANQLGIEQGANSINQLRATRALLPA